MSRGTVLVVGGEPGWVAALSRSLAGSELSALPSGEEGAPNWSGADAPDFILMRDDRPDTHSSSSWLLYPAQVSGRASSEGVLLGEPDTPPEEIAQRLARWLERERLAENQREIVAELEEARRALEVERESLRAELARANAGLERANAELRERVDQLSRLNRELEHSRELNANVIDVLQESLIACDEAGCITHWSRDATAFLGWTREQVIARPVREVLRPAEGSEATFHDLLETRGRRSVQVRFIARDRRTRVAEVRVSSLGEEGGRGLVLLLTDVARRQREEEHLRRRDRLASLGELSAGVAHEIRNPLAGITTTAELLRARLPEASSDVEFVDVILEEVVRLDKIITDLLLFARPRRPEPVRGDLHRTLDRMLLLLRRQAGKRDVEIVRHYQRGLPMTALDPDQALQLFLNLGLNAIESMKDGGALRVKTEALSMPRPGDPERTPVTWTRVSIADTGCGIPAGIRDKVFNPFFTTKGRGSGLGLAICQRIVEDHDGLIDLESIPGQGTTVTVDFPMSDAATRVDLQTDLFANAGEEHGSIPGGAA